MLFFCFIGIFFYNGSGIIFKHYGYVYMGLSIRFFIYREGEVKRIPQAKYQRFLDGEPEFLEYANETLKMAEIVVTVENWEVIEIVRSVFYLQKVEEDGSQGKEFKMDKMRHAVNQIEPLDLELTGLAEPKEEKPENLIDASNRFEERRLDALCVWEPEYKVVHLLEDAAFL